MTTARISAVRLAPFFLRTWPVRLGAIMIAFAGVALFVTAGVVQAFQLSPTQRAEANVGTFDAVVSMAGAAPVGRSTSAADRAFAQAVLDAGGRNTAIEYLALGLQADGSTDNRVAVDELATRAAIHPATRLLDGSWPSQIGYGAVSAALAARWPIGHVVSFFGGALRIRVTGTYRDDLDRDAEQIIVPSGTWNSLTNIPRERANRLDLSATRNIYWNGATAAVFARVSSTASSHPSFDPGLTNSPLQMQTSIDITSQATPVVPQLLLATFLVPLAVGGLAGLVGGRVITRSRLTMWQIGVPLRSTRPAASAATLLMAVLASVIGLVLGLAASTAARVLADTVNTHQNGPVRDVAGAAATYITLTALGALVGMWAARPRLRDSNEQRTARRGNRRFWSLIGAAALVAIGAVFSQAASDLLSLTIAAAAFSSAVVLFAPSLITLVGRLDHGPLGIRLAVRRISEERRAAAAVIVGIGIIEVVAISLAILLASFTDTINSSTESTVAAGQITFQPQLASDAENAALRRSFDKLLHLPTAIDVDVADQAVQQSDGATLLVANITDVAKLLNIRVTEQEGRILTGGGTLRFHSDGATQVTFPTSGDFKQRTVQAVSVTKVDPSFLRFDGILLRSAAIDYGMKPVQRTYYYVDTTAAQRAAVPAAEAKLSINTQWARVYRTPDTLVAPLRFAAAAVGLAVLGALVMAISAAADARAMRPVIAGLVAVGLRRSNVRGIVLVRTLVIVAISSVSAIIASIIGVAAALNLAHATVTLSTPVGAIATLLLLVIGAALISSLVATRRIHLTERLG